MIQSVLPSRRAALVGLSAALAAPAIVRAQVILPEFPFRLGVASGDPTPDGFVIWTRLAPRPLELHSGMPMVTIPVAWEVASDEAMSTVVAKGETLARPELGHAVHVEVSGLMPNRPYWYRFTVGRDRSLRGRARTAPPAGVRLDRVRFASAGCQAYEDGLYTAYRHMVGEELDFVWCYGDYIYENRGATVWTQDNQPVPVLRAHASDEIYSLDDYRARYAQYKLDTDLQAAHAAHTWWMTWDDHETDNNWAGENGPDGVPPEVFALRRQAAAQAYWENMPLRMASFPRGPAIQLYRRAQYGDLLSAHFLDTRQFRTDQPCGDGIKAACADASRADGTITGAAQERWLFEGLDANPARWSWIAQQVMVMPLDRHTQGEQPIYNLDSWSGYQASRKRLIDHLVARKLTNVVVTTGDEHQHFAGDLLARGAEGAPAAVEFVATSISSGGDGQDLRPGWDRILAQNPFLKLVNNQRGYIVCDIGRDVWRTDIKVLDTVRRPGGTLSNRASFAVERGNPGLKPA